MTVPFIDLAPFPDGTTGTDGTAGGQAAVARAVNAACADIGFFTIAGHGVPEGLVARMLESCARTSSATRPTAMHRVVNPPRSAAAGNRRLSIPFFHQPNYDAPVEVPPELLRTRQSAALRAGHLRPAPAHQVPAGRRRSLPLPPGERVGVRGPK